MPPARCDASMILPCDACARAVAVGRLGAVRRARPIPRARSRSARPPDPSGGSEPFGAPARPLGRCIEERPGNDEFLDLGRPFVNPQWSDLAIEALDFGVGDDANAAMELNGLVHDALRRLRR